MKKTINYRLTLAEKQILKTKKVSQKLLQDYAPDEIATLLEASPQRARELSALAEFQSIPSVGPKFARDLIDMGYYSLKQLKDKNGAELLNEHERFISAWTDPCVEDQFRLIVHHANNPNSKKQWWDFTAERKAFRAEHGYPETRPAKTWMQLEQYLKQN